MNKKQQAMDRERDRDRETETETERQRQSITKSKGEIMNDRLDTTFVVEQKATGDGYIYIERERGGGGRERV